MRQGILLLSLFVASTAHSASVGLNYLGSGQAEGRFPPDSHGAVGPEQVALIMNGRYRVFDKSSGEILATQTLNNFWAGAGAAPVGQSFDPRIVYDAFSQRFFAVSVDNARGQNSFLVGVSKSSNLLEGWNAFKIDSDNDDQHWADFPTIGVNADGFYSGANMFAIGAGAEPNVNVLFVPKADLLAANPTATNARVFQDVLEIAGFSPQPVIDLNGGSLPQLLISCNRTLLDGARLAGTASAPTFIEGPASFVQFESDPSPANQPGESDDIDTGNTRLSSTLVQRDGFIWGVHGVGRGGGASVQWFRLRADNMETVEEGLIRDRRLSYYYPSIAVNEFGDVVIGFSGSSDTRSVSSYAAVGKLVDGVTTFETPMLIAEGAADAEYSMLDGNGRNRWGDYSATVVDPSNALSFWTFQEIVIGTNQFGVQVTQILIPEPGLGMVLAAGLILLTGRHRSRGPGHL